MEVRQHGFTVKDIVEWNGTGKICYDENYQRVANQWTRSQESLLIDSLIRGFKVPALWVERVESVTDKIPLKYNVIDGRQRINTMYKFLNGKFKLDKDLDPYIIPAGKYDNDSEDIVIELAGKKFSQLPAFIQNKIKDTPMEILIMLDYTKEEKEEQFFRLNNGSLFTKQQKATVELGTDLINKLKPITEHSFWERSGLSNTQKKHGVIMETVLKSLMLLTEYDYGTAFGANQVMKFAEYYSKNFIQEEIDYCYQLFDKLNEILPDDDTYNTFLKPVNIPNLIMQIHECLASEGEEHGDIVIDDDFFRDYLTEFINYIDNTGYNDNCGKGTTNKKKVDGRTDSLHEWWIQFYSQSFGDGENNGEMNICKNTESSIADILESSKPDIDMDNDINDSPTEDSNDDIA